LGIPSKTLTFVRLPSRIDKGFAGREPDKIAEMAVLRRVSTVDEINGPPGLRRPFCRAFCDLLTPNSARFLQIPGLALNSRSDLIRLLPFPKQMNPLKKLSTLSAVAVFFSSCAIADFTQYSGQQQNWPTQPGAFVATQ
jgi:hypothetical protein